MGGNVRDWTSTRVLEGEGEGSRDARVLRGGAWLMGRLHPRCAARGFLEPSYVAGIMGIRLVHSPGGDPIGEV
jgi:formylglycine-generating enzyme required for sulfatase activity